MAHRMIAWLIVPPCCKNRVVFLSLNKLGDSRGRRTAYLQQRPLSFPMLAHLSVHIHFQCLWISRDTIYSYGLDKDVTDVVLVLCSNFDDSFWKTVSSRVTSLLSCLTHLHSCWIRLKKPSLVKTRGRRLRYQFTHVRKVRAS